MKQLSHKVCPICASSEINFTAAQVIETWATPYTVGLCNECNLYFLTNHPPELEIQKRYCVDYYQLSWLKNLLKPIFRQFRCKSQCDYILNRIQFKAPNIFEIGAGDGVLLKIMKEAVNAQVSGVEPSIKMRKIAMRKYNVMLEPPEINQHHNKHDIIILSHVLEHFTDINTTLRDCRNRLKPNGYIFIELPQSPLYPKECTKDELQKYIDTEHIFNFRSENITMLLEREGFQILHLDRFFYNIPLIKSKTILRRIGNNLLGGTTPCLRDIPLIFFYTCDCLMRLRNAYKIYPHDVDWLGYGDCIRVIAKPNKTSNPMN